LKRRNGSIIADAGRRGRRRQAGPAQLPRLAGMKIERSRLTAWDVAGRRTSRAFPLPEGTARSERINGGLPARERGRWTAMRAHASIGVSNAGGRELAT